ncbi:MAG: hypothetical protein JNL49_01890 [Bacteroidia bacterium]|nr:hypothetical protein [Bacteroidia bacterium]
MQVFNLEASQKKLNDTMKLAATYRGEYINEVAILEYLMEEIIVCYFTSGHKQKSLELIHAYFGSVACNFNTKRNLVIFIAEKYSEFKNIYTKMDAALQDIAAFRNIIAHQKLVLTPKVWNAFDNNTVFFSDTTTKDRKVIENQKKVNRAILDKEINKIKFTSNKCMELHRLIVEKLKT